MAILHSPKPALANWRGYLCVIALLLLGMVMLAACGSDETPTATPTPAPTQAMQTATATPTPAPTEAMMEELSGVIEVDGSSTVAPISQAVAEDFEEKYGDTQPIVGISGTGGGFKRFTVGETDISNASRPIKDSEAEAAATNGIEYLELKVGTDGLSVMVSPQNDFVDCLSMEQLNQIWMPGSTVQQWSDVNPAWPDREISLYGADTDSGTFDYFTEEVNGEAKVSRDDYTASADDNVLVRGIGGDRNSLGYFGYAYYIENEDQLKLLGIDSGEGCVKPSPETIAAGTYSPLSRPLFIYVNVESLQKPQVLEFVKFYMEVGAELTAEVGYVPEDDSTFEANLQAVLDAAN